MSTKLSNEKNFTNCLETFQDYTGLLNNIQLALLGYQHVGKNKIKCMDCNQIFISWNSDETFWKKHKQSLCFHVLDMYRITDQPISVELVTKWKNKENLNKFKEMNQIPQDYLDWLIIEYLTYKGEYGNLHSFKEFFNYIKNFRNLYILD